MKPGVQKYASYPSARRSDKSDSGLRNAWAHSGTWHRATEIMRELSVRKAQWYMRPGLEKRVSLLSARRGGAWDQAFRNTYLRCLSQRLWCVWPGMQKYVNYISARRIDVWNQGSENTGLFEMIVGVLTTCHTQYTWDRSICIFFLFNRTTLQVFVTYLTGALYVHPLWFYKHQHDNRVRSNCL